MCSLVNADTVQHLFIQTGYTPSFSLRSQPDRIMQKRLLLKSADLPGAPLEFSEASLPITLGRSSRADLTIADPLLSRIHSEIIYNEAGEFEIRDQESTNLTIVNGEHVDRQILRSKDVLHLGDTTLYVEVTTQEDGFNEQTTREIDALADG